MFLMLMPSLACAMPLCAGGKQAETMHQPCANHQTGHHKGKKETGKINLLVNCMGVDMQQADMTRISKPDLKTDFVVYVPVTDIVSHQIAHTGAGSIRAPPPDWPDLYETQPSLILTTQRLRI